MSDIYKVFGLLLFMAIFFHGVAFGDKENQKSVSVDKADICIKDSESEDYLCKGNIFSFSDGKLYCISKISGLNESSVIMHYWIYKGRIMASYPFTSTSSKAKFMSPKSVSSDQVGDWSVEIRDEDGSLLKVLSFKLTGQ